MNSSGFLNIHSSSLDVGCHLTIRQYSSSVEVRAPWRPIHDWWCSQTHCQCFYSTDSVFVITAMLKKYIANPNTDSRSMVVEDQNLTGLFCFFNNSICFKKVSSTTGWNAAPLQQILHRVLWVAADTHCTSLQTSNLSSFLKYLRRHWTSNQDMKLL